MRLNRAVQTIKQMPKQLLVAFCLENCVLLEWATMCSNDPSCARMSKAPYELRFVTYSQHMFQITLDK